MAADRVPRYSWHDLALATLARQFPAWAAGTDRAGPTGVDDVVRLVGQVGPIQTQVARAAYGAVWSRLPGTPGAVIEQAYESFRLVRGSNLRTTVHTCTREQHAVLDAVTRRATEPIWRRALRLRRVGVADVRQAMTEAARDDWLTQPQLRAHLVDWLAANDSPEAAASADTAGMGRAMAHIHGGLVRRPLGGTWHSQATPGYRSAVEVLGEGRDDVVADPQAALVALTRIHLAAFGPSSRRDLAWFTGDGLRNLDAALACLADELTVRPGPGGLDYYDLLGAPTEPVAEVGVRLLPEFDALVIAYDSRARDRFADPARTAHYWSVNNGLLSAVVLADGRVRAAWGLTGSGERRTVVVRMLPGERALDPALLTDQVRAVEVALDLTVTDVEVRCPVTWTRVDVRLPFTAPLFPDNLFGHLVATAAPGVEEWRNGAYRCAFRLPGGPAVAGLSPRREHVAATRCWVMPETWTPPSPAAVACSIWTSTRRRCRPSWGPTRCWRHCCELRRAAGFRAVPTPPGSPSEPFWGNRSRRRRRAPWRAGWSLRTASRSSTRTADSPICSPHRRPWSTSTRRPWRCRRPVEPPCSAWFVPWPTARWCSRTATGAGVRGARGQAGPATGAAARDAWRRCRGSALDGRDDRDAWPG